MGGKEQHEKCRGEFYLTAQSRNPTKAKSHILWTRGVFCFGGLKETGECTNELKIL